MKNTSIIINNNSIEISALHSIQHDMYVCLILLQFNWDDDLI